MNLQALYHDDQLSSIQRRILYFNLSKVLPWQKGRTGHLLSVMKCVCLESYASLVESLILQMKVHLGGGGFLADLLL